LRQAEKTLEVENNPENRKEVEKYTLDLYYAMHFPLTEKYIALYPKTPIENQEILEKRDKIRQRLREEILHGKKKVSGSNNVQLGRRKKNVQEDEEDSEAENGKEGSEEEDGEEEDEYLQF
jgi:hypothetical protein